MDPIGIGEILATAAVWLLWIGVIVLIGRGVVSLFRRRRDPAVETLRSRFARGEIDEAEYERLRTTLQRG
jgi:LPXTG-motif cell wall-anchored protein